MKEDPKIRNAKNMLANVELWTGWAILIAALVWIVPFAGGSMNIGWIIPALVFIAVFAGLSLSQIDKIVQEVEANKVMLTQNVYKEKFKKLNEGEDNEKTITDFHEYGTGIHYLRYWEDIVEIIDLTFKITEDFEFTSSINGDEPRISGNFLISLDRDRIPEWVSLGSSVSERQKNATGPLRKKIKESVEDSLRGLTIDDIDSGIAKSKIDEILKDVKEKIEPIFDIYGLNLDSINVTIDFSENLSKARSAKTVVKTYKEQVESLTGRPLNMDDREATSFVKVVTGNSKGIEVTNNVPPGYQGASPQVLITDK